MIIDTHCHLNDECYDADRENIISNFENDNLKSAFVVGTDKKTCSDILNLIDTHSELYGILGMYPENVSEYDDEFERFLIDALKNERVVAVGEIGLDFHTEGYNQALQEEVFAKQIKIAKMYNLPLSIHTREAFDRTIKILKDNKEYLSGGVIHCFSGSPEIAKEFIKLGFKLGFGGVCTFKNARKVVDTIKEIDVKDILLETDAPYLAPTPFRGTRNEPKHTNLVLDKIAEIRGEDSNYLEEQIYKNTLETFGRYKG